MTIARSPHPTFSILWALWLANVIAALAFPDDPIYGLVVLLTYIPIEGAAVYLRTPWRDTFSEIATWVQRHTSKHRIWLRGWNALFTLFIVCIATLLGRTVDHYSGMGWLGWTLGVLLLIWLMDHLYSPDKHG